MHFPLTLLKRLIDCFQVISIHHARGKVGVEVVASQLQ
jgi:hypothetical protein